MLLKQQIAQLLAISISIAVMSTLAMSSEINEAELKKKYEAFAQSLDTARIAKDYPRAVAQLDSDDPDKIVAAMRTLAATEEVEVIPWLVPFLDSDNSSIRLYAGLYLSNVVNKQQLRRRDMSQPSKVVIKPLAEGDLDLRPVAWPILKMLRGPDDGSSRSYAASMAGYLGLKEFEPQLREILASRHPAVSRSALYAYEQLGLKPPKTASSYELNSTDSSYRWIIEDRQKINKGRFDIAYSLIQKGKYEEALELLQANIKSDPDAGNADYWYGWAVVCLANLERYDEMLPYYQLMRTKYNGWLIEGAGGARRNWDARLYTAQQQVAASNHPDKNAVLRKMTELDESAIKDAREELEQSILRAGDGDRTAIEQLKKDPSGLIDLIIEGRLILKPEEE